MASVSGIFFGQALENLGRVEPEVVEFVADGARLGQLQISVALGGDELAANFDSSHAGVEAKGAEARVGLTLGGDEILDVTKEVGQVFLGAKASASGEVVLADDAGGEFVRALADGDSVPAQFGLGASLAAFAQGTHRAGHEQTTLHASQLLRRLDQDFLHAFAQLDHLDLPFSFVERSFYCSLGYLFFAESLTPRSTGCQPVSFFS